MTDPKLPRLALIAGPTASGKSALAMALAERHDGTVINADSMQVYADLRILTARPSVADETRAPHRLFGHIDGADEYSAARWAAEARAAIHETHSAGRLPILVGGTGMYIRTLIDGIAPVPEIDPAVRAAVRAASVAENHAALVVADPAAAARLNPADTTRVARALEVVRSSRRTLAEWQVDRQGGIGEEVTLLPLILLPPRDWLEQRCFDRADAMLREGLVEEVEALLTRTDIAPSAPVMRAIGIPEIIRMAQEGLTQHELIVALRLATLQYAKRQYTWFRNQSPDDWQRTEQTETNQLLDIFETKLRY
jgi:tRNA dimethylallyltransferase